MKRLVVEVVAHDPRWPARYEAERDLILSVGAGQFVGFEHVGSTSVPGLRAKPIIDMMASVESLERIDALLNNLDELGYQVIEAGMRNRLFLRRSDKAGQVFHLHLVEHATWDERKERHLRDHLRANPQDARDYGELKDELAARHAHDVPAYTKAKTAFIQRISDRMRDAKGLPRIEVWED